MHVSERKAPRWEYALINGYGRSLSVARVGLVFTPRKSPLVNRGAKSSNTLT